MMLQPPTPGNVPTAQPRGSEVPAGSEVSVDAILQATNPLPMWTLILLSLLAVAFVAFLYATERGRGGRGLRLLLAGLRSALLLSVLWMLLGWSWLRFTSDRPELVVLLDRSGSMNTSDGFSKSDQRNRLQRAIDILAQVPNRQREQLESSYKLRWFTLADDLEAIDLDWSELSTNEPSLTADGAQSRLGDGLRRVLERQAGSGTAAVIFFSDGVNTAGSQLRDAADAARMAAIPIHSVVVGQQYPRPDVRLADLLLDRSVYLGDQVVLEATVLSSDVRAANPSVSLRDVESGELLDEVQVELGAGLSQTTAQLSFVPKRPGPLQLAVEVAPVEQEKELENNRQLATVEVQDRSIRVLMVFESPSYEFRFLKSFLERSMQQAEGQAATFQLDCVLQDADEQYVKQDATAIRLVPSDRQRLEEYDVFVFGEFDPGLVSRTAQQTIYEAVTQRGAGCIFLCGGDVPPAYLAGWPLADLLPVQSIVPNPPSKADASYVWRLAPVGAAASPLQLGSSFEQTQSIWRQFPAIRTVASVGEVKPGAQVLATAVEEASGAVFPLLITQFAGAGRAALQATDETYVWTSVNGTDLYHQRYWGQTLRWLARNKLMRDDARAELLIEPKQIRLGQTARAQLTLGAEGSATAEQIELRVEGDAAASSTFPLQRIPQSPNMYRGEIAGLPAGSYRAFVLLDQAEPLSQEFTVTAPPSEQANLQADLEAMRTLAEQSRGRFYSEAELGGLFEDLPSGRRTRLGTLPPKPLWNSPWVALLFLSVLTAEWILRRRARML